jgi:hypothetical protein
MILCDFNFQNYIVTNDLLVKGNDVEIDPAENEWS